LNAVREEGKGDPMPSEEPTQNAQLSHEDGTGNAGAPDVSSQPDWRTALTRLALTLGVVWLFAAFGAFLWVNRTDSFLVYLNMMGGRTPLWRLDMEGAWLGFPKELVTQARFLFWTVAALAIVGMRLFARIRPGSTRAESFVWGTGLAVGGWGTLVFLIGLAGLLGHARIVFDSLLDLLKVLGFVFLLWKQNRAPQPVPVSRGQGLSWPEWALIGALAALHLVAFFYAFTPAAQSDALRYHLAAPQEWLKAGGLVYLPWNAFSNFPSTVEMLFLYGLGLGGDLLATGFHFLFLPLTTVAVGLLTREVLDEAGPGAETPRFLGIRAPLLAAAAWGSVPMAIGLAGWAFIDLAILFFTLGVIYFQLRWLRSARRIDWILSGLFGGLLVASKYTGVLTVVWGAALFLLAGLPGFLKAENGERSSGDIDESGETPTRPRSGFGRALSRAVLFGLLAAALGAPWWIKSVVHTGNPVYPMAWSLFGKGGEWTQTCDDIYKEKLQEKGMGHSVGAFLALPWNVTVHLHQFEDHALGPFYWVLTLWIVGYAFRALWQARRRPVAACVALWLGFLVVSWFFTYQSNRFLMPALAVASALALAACAGLGRLAGGWRRAACGLGILLPIAYAIAYSFFHLLMVESGVTSNTNQLPVRWPAYTMGFLSRDAYLAGDSFLPGRLPYYDAARFCNRTLTPDEKVLLVGEHRKMHWLCRVEGNDWYDSPRILPFLRGAADADAVLDALSQAGFTHVFFNLDEWGWPLDESTLLDTLGRPQFPAWQYNRRHFTSAELTLLSRVIHSPRLRPIHQTRPNRIYVAQIVPRA
jgi:hypothetical protein